MQGNPTKAQKSHRSQKQVPVACKRELCKEHLQGIGYRRKKEVKGQTCTASYMRAG